MATKKRTSYDTDIVLGERYTHRKLAIEGVANSVTFFENACERVVLTWVHDGEIHDAGFDAVDLVPLEVEPEDQKPARSEKTGGPARAAAMRSGSLLGVR